MTEFMYFGNECEGFYCILVSKVAAFLGIRASLDTVFMPSSDGIIPSSDGIVPHWVINDKLRMN